MKIGNDIRNEIKIGTEPKIKIGNEIRNEIKTKIGNQRKMK